MSFVPTIPEVPSAAETPRNSTDRSPATSSSTSPVAFRSSRGSGARREREAFDLAAANAAIGLTVDDADVTDDAVSSSIRSYAQAARASRRQTVDAQGAPVQPVDADGQPTAGEGEETDGPLNSRRWSFDGEGDGNGVVTGGGGGDDDNDDDAALDGMRVGEREHLAVEQYRSRNMALLATSHEDRLSDGVPAAQGGSFAGGSGVRSNQHVQAAHRLVLPSPPLDSSSSAEGFPTSAAEAPASVSFQPEAIPLALATTIPIGKPAGLSARLGLDLALPTGLQAGFGRQASSESASAYAYGRAGTLDLLAMRQESLGFPGFGPSVSTGAGQADGGPDSRTSDGANATAPGARATGLSTRLGLDLALPTGMQVGFGRQASSESASAYAYGRAGTLDLLAMRQESLGFPGFGHSLGSGHGNGLGSGDGSLDNRVTEGPDARSRGPQPLSSVPEADGTEEGLQVTQTSNDTPTATSSATAVISGGATGAAAAIMPSEVDTAAVVTTPVNALAMTTHTAGLSPEELTPSRFGLGLGETMGIAIDLDLLAKDSSSSRIALSESALDGNLYSSVHNASSTSSIGHRLPALNTSLSAASPPPNTSAVSGASSQSDRSSRSAVNSRDAAAARGGAGAGADQPLSVQLNMPQVQVRVALTRASDASTDNMTPASAATSTAAAAGPTLLPALSADATGTLPSSRSSTVRRAEEDEELRERERRRQAQRAAKPKQYKLSESGTFDYGGFMVRDTGIAVAPAENTSDARNRATASAAARGSTAASAAASNAGTSSAAATTGLTVSTGGAGAGGGNANGGLSVGFKATSVRVEVLGQGASGTVYKMIHVPTLTLLAAKMIPLYDAGKLHGLEKELKALHKNKAAFRAPPRAASPARVGKQVASTLTHGATRDWSTDTLNPEAPCPYVVAFYDAFTAPEDGVLVFVTEYMDGGSLQDIIDMPSNPGIKSLSVLANIAWRVLKGLEFIHNKRQIHRDIKPSNMLINHLGEVKIADFGIIRELGRDETHAQTFVGTMTYMSPERIKGEPYTYNSDIWSLGLSILACATGRFPLDVNGGYWGMFRRITEEPPPAVPDHFSSNFKDFIAQCLIKDPKERPDATALLKHPFVAGCGSLLRRPRPRPGGAGIGATASSDDSSASSLFGNDKARNESSLSTRSVDPGVRNDLVQMAKRVQQYRCEAAIKQGRTSLPLIPPHRYEHLANQLGVPAVVVARIFNSAQEQWALKLQKVYQLAMQRMKEAAMLPGRPSNDAVLPGSAVSRDGTGDAGAAAPN